METKNYNDKEIEETKENIIKNEEVKECRMEEESKEDSENEHPDETIILNTTEKNSINVANNNKKPILLPDINNKGIRASVSEFHFYKGSCSVYLFLLYFHRFNAHCLGVCLFGLSWKFSNY